jgi:predicted RNase H-like nuclease (RuvC/YqgF family)
MTDYLIVGVDPGTTTSIAALDLNGRLKSLKSSKNMGLSQAINEIIKYGRPSIIASDVCKTPDFVSEIATKTGAKTYSPEKNLTVEEKTLLTRDYPVCDSHQRDSLAAAVNAYRKHSKKLGKITRMGYDDGIKHLVLKGMSIHKALQETREPEKNMKPEAKPETAEPQPGPQERKLRDLERQIKSMQKSLSERDSTIESLRDELLRAKRISHTSEKHPPPIEKSLKNLRKKMRKIDDYECFLRKTLDNEYLPVGVYPKALGGRTLIERQPAGMDGITTVFTSKKRVKEALSEKYEVYDAKNLSEKNGHYYITSEKLGMLRSKKTQIDEIIMEYRKNRK